VRYRALLQRHVLYRLLSAHIHPIHLSIHPPLVRGTAAGNFNCPPTIQLATGAFGNSRGYIIDSDIGDEGSERA